jgi:hypothetical protein
VRLGDFISHSGSKGTAYRDEIGRCWMEFSDGFTRVPYSLIYVKEWLPEVPETGETKGGNRE